MEFTAAARTCPTKGLRQPVRMVLAAQVGAPTNAGSQLRRCYRIGTVIRIQSDNTSILHVSDQQTSSSAIVGGTADPDLFFICQRGNLFGLHESSVHK